MTWADNGKQKEGESIGQNRYNSMVGTPNSAHWPWWRRQGRDGVALGLEKGTLSLPKRRKEREAQQRLATPDVSLRSCRHPVQARKQHTATTHHPPPTTSAWRTSTPTTTHDHSINNRKMAARTRARAAALLLLALASTACCTAFLLPTPTTTTTSRLASSLLRLHAATTASSLSTSLPPSTAIIGAGPTGLFTALVLARRGYSNITVYDRLPRPDDPASPNWGNPYVLALYPPTHPPTHDEARCTFLFSITPTHPPTRPQQLSFLQPRPPRTRTNRTHSHHPPTHLLPTATVPTTSASGHEGKSRSQPRMPGMI